MPVFGKELVGSEVVGSDGTNIGHLEDIEYDAQTKNINHILVKPGANTPTARVTFNKEGNLFRVPADAVKAAKDRVLVDH
jgi:sporulation protein YlmC with PRC-barrel domain